MAPILNSVEMLKLVASADANVHQANGVIERQIKQMVRLVDDLLDLTRIAEGKIDCAGRRSTSRRRWPCAIQTVTPLFEAQKHQLSASLPTEPLRMGGDQDRIVQILVNLLTNAGKYTDRGGRITLTAELRGRRDHPGACATTGSASKGRCWAASSISLRKSTNRASARAAA